MSDKLEALEEALELLDQLRDALQAGGLMDDPHFRAYHACELEGREGGWLGGPFLADALRDAHDDALHGGED